MGACPWPISASLRTSMKGSVHLCVLLSKLFHPYPTDFRVACRESGYLNNSCFTNSRQLSLQRRWMRKVSRTSYEPDGFARLKLYKRQTRSFRNSSIRACNEFFANLLKVCYRHDAEIIPISSNARAKE